MNNTTTVQTTTRYRVEFSIYGSAATPAWKRAVVSAITVYAETEDQARTAAAWQVPSLATDPAAIHSVTRV